MLARVRRPRLWGAIAVAAVACGLLALQPLRSPWWSGFDFDAVYVASALKLAAGERSNFYDHPGAPLQEALAGTFVVSWLAGGGDRQERIDAWLANLDSTTPYLRGWASVFFVASALLVFFTVAWVFRHAGWGVLAALLFLGAPDVVTWAAVIKTDPLLAALGVAAVGLAIEGVRRRSAALYLASAFAIGFDVSVKIHAVGLVVPLALALALAPPASGWWHELRADASAFVRRRRGLLLAVALVWLALVALLNATAAAPAARDVAQAALGLGAAAIVAVAVWLLARTTRVASRASIAIAAAGAGLAGAVVPNLFFASVPAPMLRWLAITATGGGVNRGARPALSPLDVLEPWNLTILVALIGAVVAIRARDHPSLLWAAGALAMGFLAYLRYGEFHYYAPAIALLAPLALRALAEVSPRPGLVAAVVGAALLWSPLRLAVESARDRVEIADRTERVNAWVEPRLGRDEVALTRLESDDGRFFYVVRDYAPAGYRPSYRFLPVGDEAAAYVREHSLRVAYVVTGAPEDVGRLLGTLGLPGSPRRADAAPGYVYEVR